MRRIRFVHRRIKGAWGLAWPDQWKIALSPNMDDRTHMDIAIHEGLHCVFPDLSEEAVNQAGITLADLLWRLGYRRNEEE
jgi:hypothetical protein